MIQSRDHASMEVLQQRLLEEIEAQQRLQEELKSALENERDLRLENDLLWVYLQQRHPSRVGDAESLLARLVEGSELANELQPNAGKKTAKNRTLKQKVRGGIGKLPGVHRAYHCLKNIGK